MKIPFKDLPRLEANRPDVEMRIWVVTHIGRMAYHFSVPATNEIYATIAYLRMFKERFGVDVHHELVVVRAGPQNGVSRPLLGWTVEGVINYLNSDPLSDWLVDASVGGIRDLSAASVGASIRSIRSR